MSEGILNSIRIKKLIHWDNPLGYSQFRYLYLSYTISRAGDWVYFVTLNIWIFELTQSTTITGIAAALMSVPRLLLGPILGTLSDRHPPVKVLILCDLLRVLLLLPLLLIRSPDQIGIAFVVLPLLTTLGTLFSSSRRVLLGVLFTSKDLIRATSVFEMTDSVLTIAGPPIGVLLFTRLGFSWVIWANSISFLASALLLLPLLRKNTYHAQPTIPSVRPSLKKSLQETFLLFKNSASHFRMMIFVSLFSIANGIFMALHTAFVLKYAGLSEAQFGQLISLQGVGGMIGAGSLMKWAQGFKPAKFLGIATGVSALCVAAAVAYPTFWSLAVSTFIEGIFVTSVFISIPVLVTQLTREDLRGRAFGSLESIEHGFMAAAMVSAGILASAFSFVTIYAFGATILLAASLYSLLRLKTQPTTLADESHC